MATARSANVCIIRALGVYYRCILESYILFYLNDKQGDKHLVA